MQNKEFNTVNKLHNNESDDMCDNVIFTKT
jgi:hypothetical protein